jgi:hypothetical protein
MFMPENDKPAPDSKEMHLPYFVVEKAIFQKGAAEMLLLVNQ